MSQKQTSVSLGKLISYFAGYDSLAHSGPTSVEADETYVGGKRHDGMCGRGASGKTPGVGSAERKGEIRLEVTENTKAVTLDTISTDHVEPGATVMTDEYRPYSHVTRLGYKHRRVNHGKKDFVIGQNHTNTSEGAWSH